MFNREQIPEEWEKKSFSKKHVCGHFAMQVCTTKDKKQVPVKKLYFTHTHTNLVIATYVASKILQWLSCRIMSDGPATTVVSVSTHTTPRGWG